MKTDTIKVPTLEFKSLQKNSGTQHLLVSAPHNYNNTKTSCFVFKYQRICLLLASLKTLKFCRNKRLRVEELFTKSK